MRALFLICFTLIASQIFAQADTLKVDSTGRIIAKKKFLPLKIDPNKYNPNVAVWRSVILPGWGQVTNKKYWKLPLVYGALGTTAFIFFRNVNQYKDASSAYILATDTIPGNDTQIKEPYYSVRNQPERIRTFRNQVRQNVDYSVLFFILFWGLNVADAAVDAHLKTFDVNDDLTLKIKAGYSPMAHTSGVSFILGIK